MIKTLSICYRYSNFNNLGCWSNSTASLSVIRMNVFNLISQHFWLVFIIITFANAGIMFKRSRAHVATNPELEDGYKSIIKGVMTWGNIPWVVMGAGILFGGVPSIWHYFRPIDGNYFVIGWFISVFLIWFLGTYWLFIKGGAELLVTHPGIFNRDLKSAGAVKLVWLLCLAGGIAGVTMMFLTDVPVPTIR